MDSMLDVGCGGSVKPGLFCCVVSLNKKSFSFTLSLVTQMYKCDIMLGVT